MKRVLTNPYLGLTMLIAVALLSLWWRQQQPGEQASALDEAQLPDYYLKDFVATTMDETGRPARRLVGASMEQYPDRTSADLDAPLMHVFRKDSRVWVMASETAEVYDGGASVWLQGAVHIFRERHAGDGRIDIYTQDLWVYPEQDYAESEHPVTVEDALGVTRGVGVRVDLTRGWLSLLDRVRGMYEVH